jgi:hypothetical protein
MLSVSKGCGKVVASSWALRNRDARGSYKIYYGSSLNAKIVLGSQHDLTIERPMYDLANFRRTGHWIVGSQPGFAINDALKPRAEWLRV